MLGGRTEDHSNNREEGAREVPSENLVFESEEVCGFRVFSPQIPHGSVYFMQKS